MAVTLADDCEIIGKPVGQSPKALKVKIWPSSSPTGLFDPTHLIPLASWPIVSCGNVKMVAVLLVFLVVAMVPAMARDLCQGGECKCNGVIASCSGQDIKVSIRLFIFDPTHPLTLTFLLSLCRPS